MREREGEESMGAGQGIRSDEAELHELRAQVARLTRELRQSEERLRLVHDRSPLPCHSLDEQGRVLEVNDAWLSLFGYDRGEVLGRWLGELLTEASREAFPERFAHFLATGEVRGAEMVFRHKQGETVTVAVDGSVLRLESGGLRTHCVLRNITRERAEQRMMERSEALYRTMFDDAAIPIAIGRDLKILYANRAQALSVGYESREELIGKHVLSFIAPHCALEFAERARRRMSGEDVESQYEVDVVRRDGSIFTALATVSGVNLPDGPAMLGFFQDLSERKRMEDALRQSEARFRMLFDEVPAIAVQGYDQERNVIYWNEASVALYGYSREEALGRKLEDLIIPPHMRQGVQQAIADWLERDIAIPAGELGLMRKDGSIVPVFSNHVMQHCEDGTREIYCLDIDLSDLTRTRDALTRAKEAAEAASQAKGEFLANMSHEIRTPMNGVLGMLQLLRAGDLRGDLREFADMAHNAATRLLSLLNDILDFSRLESGVLAMRHAPLHLGELVQSVVEMFRQTTGKKGLSLGFTVDPSLPQTLLGDEARLRQVLFNLVGNAVKFTRKGHIHVHAWQRKQQEPGGGVRVYFSVQDTGVGIPDDKVDLVFERFTQTDGSYTRQYEGAGLGLAIVKRIVELMGGGIVVESQLGEGTTVYWNVLLERNEDAASVASPLRAVSRIPGRSLRVLVADDDRIGLMAARLMLERQGHVVTTVTNGLEAVKALRQEAFDCVLMDIQMPTMDGVDATSAIRHDPALGARAKVPIIALTAYAMSGDREKFLTAGMDGYVSKPVQEIDLLKAIEQVTSGRAAA